MIVKPGFEYTKRTKYVHVYKKDNEFFTHSKLCKWYAILKWRESIGYIKNVKNVFLKDRFPFRYKNKRYEFLPQFKIQYPNETYEYQVYTIVSIWYWRVFKKAFVPKYEYLDIRFLDEKEIRVEIKDMKSILNYNELIETRLLKEMQ